MIEETRVRREVRPRRATDWLLVDNDQSFDFVGAFGDLAAERFHGDVQPVVIFIGLVAMSELVSNCIHKELAYQARLSGSRYSSDAGKDPQGNVDVEAIEVVADHPTKLQPLARTPRRFGGFSAMLEQVAPGL